MTLTDEELKALAEKAAKWLGLECNNPGIGGVCNVPNTKLLLAVPDSFYNDRIVAPILAHLTLERMEKEFFIQYQTDTGADLQLIHIWHFTPRVPPYIRGGGDQNENKFIALWLAVEATGVLDV